MLGHHLSTRETLFKWWFAGEPIMARFSWHFHALSPHQLKNTQQKQTKKNPVRVGPPLKKLPGSVHDLEL